MANSFVEDIVYTIDLRNGVPSPSPSPFIDFIVTPQDSNGDTWLETVLKINLNDPNLDNPFDVAEFQVKYDGTPTNWTVNIGDSATNNGFAGDGGTQSNDAEVQILGDTLAAYSNDTIGPPQVNRILVNRPGFASSDSTVNFEVSDDFLGWDNNSDTSGNLNSRFLYALNGQPDTEGPVNYDIFAAFNRVIANNSRIGSGVGKVTIRLRDLPSSLTVDTLVDENDGDLSPGDVSLREAIAFIDDGGTIDFAEDLTGTIVLDADLGQLWVDKPLIIEGSGADTITVSGGNQVRVLYITADVEIQNLTIANGRATFDGDIYNDPIINPGGAIYNTGNLTVSHSTFSNNTAFGNATYYGTGSGGAIYNKGNLTISHSTFQNNSAGGTFAYGGGIFNTGQMIVNDSILNNNSASSPFGASGGGIYSSGGHLTLNNSTVNGNGASGSRTGSGDGGGISITSGELAVSNSLIEHNRAIGASASGGGIYSADSTLTVSNSTVRYNDAEGTFHFVGSGDGGGIHSRGDLTLSHSVINNNSVLGSEIAIGGGISTMGNTTISNSTISGNVVESTGFPNFGGGIYNDGFLELRNSTLTQNTAPLDQGSGIATGGDSTVEVVSSIIAGNTNSDVDFFISDGTVNSFVSQGNNLIGTGNALSAFNQPGDLTGITDPGLEPLADNGGSTQTHALKPNSLAIDAGSNPDNLSTDQRGAEFERVINDQADIGAFEIQFIFSNITVDTLIDENDGDLSAGDVSLREAIAFVNEGGTIDFAPELSGTILLDPDLGTLVVDNSITVDGPGADIITVSGGDQVRVFNLVSGEINDLTIANGNADGGGGERDGFGGGILIPTGGGSFDDFAIIRNVIVSDNNANSGGGLYNDEGFVEVIDSVFSNNVATEDGGGIFNEVGDAGGTLIIDGSTFENNTATSGGGIFAFRGDVTINNSSVAFNTAEEGGGGIKAVLGEVTINNSFVNINSAEKGDGGGIYSVDGDLTLNNSEVGANSAKEGDGGGIYSLNASLTVSNSDVSNNDALGGSGGGIFSRDTSVAVNDSTLNKNIAGGDGGGIYSVNGDLTVSNTAVVNSFTAEPESDGGGLSSRGSSLIVRNSTISGNGTGINVATPAGQISVISNSTISSNETGGGIFNSSGVLQIRNSTITNNTSVADGSGVASFGDYNTRTEVVSSIIAGNADNDDVAFIFGSENSFVSQGNNLIGNGNATSAFTAPGDQIIGNDDPGLEPLFFGDYGRIYNLQAGSPAIDAGSNPDGLATDQRGEGFDRVVNGQADIGAFEVQLGVLDVGLYDADSDILITVLNEGDEIFESTISGRNLTIAAFVPEDSSFFGQVETIWLNLNNGEVIRVEGVEPYSLFGDVNIDDYNGGPLPFGENQIRFDVYGLGGDLLGTVIRSFSIVEDLDIGLYDADSDELITPLNEGDELLASTLEGRKVTIAAFVPEESPFFSQVESMRLNLNDGEVIRTENTEPYALFGDINENYSGGTLPFGDNRIAFEVYSDDNLQGDLLGTVTRNFTISNDL